MHSSTVAVFAFLVTAVPFAQTGALHGEWRSYGGDDGSTKYAPLDQIDAGNVNRLQIAWQVPLGDGPRQQLIEMGVSDPGPLGGGAFTGPMVTKTLLFLGLGGGRGSTQRPVLEAFDKMTGEIVYAVDLPATLTGTPMTSMAGGKQYIVAAFGSGAEAGLIALALP